VIETATTIRRFEPCPDCCDGSCGRCGAASSEHAGPGVRAVIRKFMFVRCCDTGCNECGALVHRDAAPGVRLEVVTERTTKRWAPALHLLRGERVWCGWDKAVELGAVTENVDDPRTCGKCKRAKARAHAGRADVPIDGMKSRRLP